MNRRPTRHTLCTDPEWQGRADCRHCGIRHMMLFSGLQEKDFDQILEPIDNLRYSTRAQLYYQGDRSDSFYSIRQGFIKLEQCQPDGAYRIVRILGPGAVIGLEALLGDAYRHTAIALQDIDVCRITAATLQRLEQEHPQLNQQVMSHWEQQLVTADRWITELSSGTVRNRVLHLLHYLQELTGDDQGNVQLFGFEDMASMLGISRETFSRTLAGLKEEGIVHETGRRYWYRIKPEAHNSDSMD